MKNLIFWPIKQISRPISVSVKEPIYQRLQTRLERRAGVKTASDRWTSTRLHHRGVDGAAKVRSHQHTIIFYRHEHKTAAVKLKKEIKSLRWWKRSHINLFDTETPTCCTQARDHCSALCFNKSGILSQKHVVLVLNPTGAQSPEMLQHYIKSPFRDRPSGTHVNGKAINKSCHSFH